MLTRAGEASAVVSYSFLGVSKAIADILEWVAGISRLVANVSK